MKRNSWLDNIPEQKRATYGLLLGVILFTIPCYCLGFVLLATIPEQDSMQPPATIPLIWTPRPTNSPAPRPTFTPYAVQPTNTLQPTPTQFFPTVVLPSVTPTFTVTPQPPTATNTPPPTNTPSPTNTPPPTNTPSPTNTSTATSTPTSTLTPTAAVPPTSTSTPSSSEPTPEPL